MYGVNRLSDQPGDELPDEIRFTAYLYVTPQDAQSTGISYSDNPPSGANRIADLALERYFVRTGVYVLIGGFFLQFLGSI
jgi:hypothetical protein